MCLFMYAAPTSFLSNPRSAAARAKELCFVVNRSTTYPRMVRVVNSKTIPHGSSASVSNSNPRICAQSVVVVASNEGMRKIATRKIKNPILGSLLTMIWREPTSIRRAARIIEICIGPILAKAETADTSGGKTNEFEKM